jgi:hypothetical protein
MIHDQHASNIEISGVHQHALIIVETSGIQDTVTHNSGLLLKPPGYWIHRLNHFSPSGYYRLKNADINVAGFQWNSEGIKKTRQIRSLV